MRCGCHSIPYKKFKKLMMRYLEQDMINCLNIFQFKNGIPSNLSPAAIILGSLNPDYNKLNIIFGAYTQIYIGTTKSKKQRTIGKIALRK